MSSETEQWNWNNSICQKNCFHFRHPVSLDWPFLLGVSISILPLQMFTHQKTIERLYKKNKILTLSHPKWTQPLSCNKERTDANSGEQLLRRRVMYAGVSNTLQDVAAGVARQKKKKKKAAKQIDKPDAWELGMARTRLLAFHWALASHVVRVAVVRLQLPPWFRVGVHCGRGRQWRAVVCLYVHLKVGRGGETWDQRNKEQGSCLTSLWASTGAASPGATRQETVWAQLRLELRQLVSTGKDSWTMFIPTARRGVDMSWQRREPELSEQTDDDEPEWRRVFAVTLCSYRYTLASRIFRTVGAPKRL